MKKCLPTEKSKDLLGVSASFQTRPLLALHSTTLSNPPRAGCHHSWLTGLNTDSMYAHHLRRFTPTNAQKIKSANYLY